MLQEKVASSEGQSGTKTILIVEDDASIGEVIALALMQEASYTPLVVADSDAALALLTGQPVHLLLIDYQLATLNGLALCDLLHAQHALRDIPVIIMSASLECHEQELRERNLAGLSKPFDVDDMLAVVKQALG
jgi:two-component system, OmpR family, response regulator VicR